MLLRQPGRTEPDERRLAEVDRGQIAHVDGEIGRPGRRLAGRPGRTTGEVPLARVPGQESVGHLEDDVDVAGVRPGRKRRGQVDEPQPETVARDRRRRTLVDQKVE